MTIKIKGKDVTLRQSFRALILFENITNKSFSPTTTLDVIIYMFCVILSSDKELDLTFDEWLDILDGNPKIMTDFSTWLMDEMTKDDTLSPQQEEEEEKKKVK